MNHNEQLEALLKRYRLEDDIPGEIKRYISSAQSRTLKVILQKEVKQAFLIACIVSLIMWAKRFGITLSLAKTTATVTTVAIVSTGAVATGTIYTIHDKIIKPIIEHSKEKDDSSYNIEIEGKQDHIEIGDITSDDLSDENLSLQDINSFNFNIGTNEKNQIEKKKAKEDKIIFTTGQYRIAVSDIDISGDSIDKDHIKTQTIVNYLNRLKGPRTAIYLKNSSLDSFPTKILFISIKKEASVFRVDARIVKTEDSKTLVNITKRASSIKHLDAQIKKIAAFITTQL